MNPSIRSPSTPVWKIAAAALALIASQAVHAQQYPAVWVGFDFGSAPFTLGQKIPFWAEPNINPLPSSDPWRGYFTAGGNYGFDISPYGPAPSGDWLVTSAAAFGTYELLLGHDAGPYPYYRVAEIKFDWAAPTTKYGTVPTMHLSAPIDGVSPHEFVQTGVCNAQGLCEGSFDAIVHDIGGRLWVENEFYNPDLGKNVNYGFYAIKNLEYLLVPTAVPEPDTYLLMLLGLGVLSTRIKSRRSRAAS